MIDLLSLQLGGFPTGGEYAVTSAVFLFTYVASILFGAFLVYRTAVGYRRTGDRVTLYVGLGLVLLVPVPHLLGFAVVPLPGKYFVRTAVRLLGAVLIYVALFRTGGDGDGR